MRAGSSILGPVKLALTKFSRNNFQERQRRHHMGAATINRPMLHTPTLEVEGSSPAGLRGQAMMCAANEKIPYRMWNRMMEEQEILQRLEAEHYTTVQREAESLETIFGEAEIPLQQADPSQLTGIWVLSKRLLGMVFLDFGDCLIYATSLAAEADEFITRDEYFRRLVLYIENPGSAPSDRQEWFKQTHDQVVACVAETIRVQEKDIRLPKVLAWDDKN